jgi:DNA topoisomerase-1
VQLGDDEQEGKPKRMSVPKGITPLEMPFQKALDLLALPRTLGQHPESQKDILAHIGRFGPYVQHQRVYASIKDPDDVFTIGYDRAMELIAEKEAKNKPLRELGLHPESGEPVNIFIGRYGPYVKHVKTNVSFGKDIEPESLTMEQALVLLAEKEGSKGKKKTAKKKTAKKKSAKKKTAKKSTAKKSTAKKKTAAKSTAARKATANKKTAPKAAKK